MYEELRKIDGEVLNFNPGISLILGLTIGLIMLGVALQIKPDHFRKIVLNPKSALIGVFSQFFLLPLMTFLVCLAFSRFITPTIALGMILVAACPGGNISNFMSSLSRANIALSVTLTAIATIAAIAMTPLNFAFYGGLFNTIYAKMEASQYLVPLRIDVAEVFKTIFVLLVIPLVLGMFINGRFPQFTAKILKPVKWTSILAFIGIVIVLFAMNFQLFKTYIKFIFILVLVHNGLAFFTGYSIASLFRRNTRDRRTITIETGIQNSSLALGLLINPNIFPPEMALGGLMFIAGWWGIWHILSGLGMAAWFSSTPIREEQLQPGTVKV